MTVFYRGPCARVTHEVLEVRCPYHRSFAIRELQYVHAVRDRTGPGAVAEPDPRVVCSAALTGAAAVVATAGVGVGAYPVVSVAAIAVGITSAVVGLRARARGRTHQLWGLYRGQLVCLFLSPDRLTFDQVSRALLRVMERLEDAR